MKNKFISSLLCVAMVLTLIFSNSVFAFAADKVGFHTEIEKASVKNDGVDTFTVDIYLDSPVKAAGVEIHLAFDTDKLEMKSATKVSSQAFTATTPADANAGGGSAGVVKLLFEDANMQGANFTAGKLYSITFATKADAEVGTITPTLSVEGLNDEEANPIDQEVTASDSIEIFHQVNTAQAVSITAPVKGQTPQATIAAADGYTGTIAWTPADATFGAGKVYKANVTLTAKDGYQFGSAATVTVEGGTVSGKQITEGGKKLTCTVAFPATATKSVTALTITTPPTKTSYVEGQNFDKTGMVVHATYDDSSEEDVTNYVVKDGNNLTVGKSTVTIEFGGKSATQNITVIAKAIESIEVTKAPTKTTYVIGDTELDKTGMEVTATYNDGSTKALTDAEYTVSGFDGTAFAEEQEITITAGGKTDTFNIKVDKKTLTKDDFTVTGLTPTYDGAAKEVTVTAKDNTAGTVTVKYDGKEEAPTDAGTYAVTFDVAESDVYKAAEGLEAGNLVIAKKAITITDATVTKRAYNGTTAVEVTAVEFDGATLENGEDKDYTVKGALKDANAGTGKDVTVTVTLKNPNYSLETYVFTGSVDIDKKAAPTVAATEATAKAGAATELQVKLAGIPADAGTATYAVGTATGTDTILAEAATVADGVVTIKLNNTGAADDTVTIPVTVTTTNYENIAANVVVTLTDKDVPAVTAKDITVTYTGEAVDVKKAEGKATVTVVEDEESVEKEVAGTWAFDGDAPVDVADSGTLTIVFTPEDEEKYAAVKTTITVTIEKATTTATAEFTEITGAGKTLADAALNVTSPVEGTFAWDDIETTAVEQGRAYGWTFTPNSGNYEPVEGTVTPWKAATPSGGGSYVPVVVKPTVTVNGEGGKTSLSADGKTLTITPDEGYVVASVTLNGKDMGAVTELKDLKATDKVTVTFAKKEEVTSEELIAQVKAVKIKATSKIVKINGKKAVKITWKAPEASELDFDGFDVFRSTKRYSGYGKKPIFTTKNTKYYNTAVKKGAKYYYKVRAYKIVDGKKVYTDWSTKAWRTVK
ncbi:MAG: hypothetical protein HFE73_11425 [Firmicutes bacterium]|nr:hypothetical protein [Bacillota bacterium]